jgi:hypothetical protein
MKRVLAASMVLAAGVGGASVSGQSATGATGAGRIPAHYSVCVTTVDAGGRARVDSGWYLEADARTRRAEVLRVGWIADGDEADREDAYPPGSIVKATIDPTLVNEAFCLPDDVQGGASAQVGSRAPSAVDRGEDIPAQFAVCVTTVDAKYARLDSFWSSDADARARRAEILKDGWITAGDQPDREDLYPPHAVVKATIDDVTVNRPSCLPPERR